MGSLDDERGRSRHARLERRLNFIAATASRIQAVRVAVRFAFAASVALALTCGVLAGLARVGLPVPRHALANTQWHGVLMLPIFFGAVVSLERAVSLGGGRHLGAPVAVALAGIALLAGLPTVLPQIMLLAGASLALLSALRLLHRRIELHLSVLALGVISWWFGDLVWLVRGTPLDAVPFWIAFLVLTIAAERLELTRLRPKQPRARLAFVLIVIVMLASLIATLHAPDVALRVFAVCLLALAAWLARYDIARVTIRQRGLTRFIAVCLLSGYGWLAVSGLLGMSGAWSVAPPLHDAALHALTLGFVVSMALGHAPIVLQAVARVRVRYSRAFYLPLIALHATLAVRIVGSLAQAYDMRRAGALGNAASLALFILLMVSAAWSARSDARLHSPQIGGHERPRP